MPLEISVLRHSNNVIYNASNGSYYTVLERTVTSAIKEAHENHPDIAIAINTLTTGGFLLEGATRNPGYIILHASRYDEFGTTQRYCFLIAEDLLSEDYVSGAQIAANHKGETLVAVGRGEISCSRVDWESFINLFGGPIYRLSPLEPEFVGSLLVLGRNELPDNLSGKADDLFEIFVHSALEFVLGGRVVRYGQARRFEERPDGLAIPSPRFIALYDAKAYGDGYKVSIDTIRQFSSYISNFNASYSSWYRLNSFILVSGTFPHTDKILERRSRELLAKSGIPLSFLTAGTFGKIVEIIKKYPLLRRSIDWSRIFTSPIVNSDNVQQQIDAILRDRIVKG